MASVAVERPVDRAAGVNRAGKRGRAPARRRGAPLRASGRAIAPSGSTTAGRIRSRSTRTTMPHIHDMIRALFVHPNAQEPLLIVTLLKAARVHGAGGRTRLRDGRDGRLRPRRAARALADAAARLPPLRHRVPDRADPRDRADGRDLARIGARDRVDLRLGDRRVPDVLPGRDRHAARTAYRGPSRGRADALVRGQPVDRALEAPVSRGASVSLHRACACRRRRASSARSSASSRRRSPAASAARSSTSRSTTTSSRRTSGRPTSSPRCSGSRSSWSSSLAEKLVVRRAPEHVA